jgi:hypothetical protein
MAHNSAKRGFFRNAVDAMVAAREKQAHRYVANALLMLDDETLRAGGFDRAELQRRSNGGAPYLF